MNRIVFVAALVALVGPSFASPNPTLTLKPAGTSTTGSSCEIKLELTAEYTPDHTGVDARLLSACSLRKSGTKLTLPAPSIPLKPSAPKRTTQLSVNASSGSGEYFVECLYDAKPLHAGLPVKSNATKVDFTGGGGVGIHSVSLSPNDVKGGNPDTDKAITLTVALDKPAPPCGQVVYIHSDNPDLARVVVDGGRTAMTIPPGKTSDALSWFLGTKNKNGKANVVVELPLTGGGFQNAFAGITVRKK